MSDTALCPFCNKYFDSTFTVENCPKCGASLKDVDLRNQVYMTESKNVMDFLIPGAAAFGVFFVMIVILTIGKITSPVFLLITAVVTWAVYRTISDRRSTPKL